jgi:hypothetical protein
MSKQSASDKRTALHTSLPTAPVNGHVIDYMADSANGIVWRFRYRASSPSLYKWEYIGGSSLRATAADVTLAANTNWQASGQLLRIVPPLAGEYEVSNFAGFGKGAGLGALSCNVGVSVGGAAPDTSNQFAFALPTASDQFLLFQGAKVWMVTVVTAGTYLEQQAKQNIAAAGGLYYRSMLVKPIRVGA